MTVWRIIETCDGECYHSYFDTEQGAKEHFAQCLNDHELPPSEIRDALAETYYTDGDEWTVNLETITIRHELPDLILRLPDMLDPVDEDAEDENAGIPPMEGDR